MLRSPPVAGDAGARTHELCILAGWARGEGGTGGQHSGTHSPIFMTFFLPAFLSATEAAPRPSRSGRFKYSMGCACGLRGVRCVSAGAGPPSPAGKQVRVLRPHETYPWGLCRLLRPPSPPSPPPACGSAPRPCLPSSPCRAAWPCQTPRWACPRTPMCVCVCVPACWLCAEHASMQLAHACARARTCTQAQVGPMHGCMHGCMRVRTHIQRRLLR